ncbi:MAG: hypothetical protein WBQ60_08155 [Asticcacaulis sp.]
MSKPDPGKFVIAAALILALALTLTACSKLKDAVADMQHSEAFLDSRIPAGLSPQYYPPSGFVWGEFRSGNLPEARYGVAAPPTNPKAHILILADADYPAEVYFELMQQYIQAGYGVWLLEAPGQGGAGHYFLQDNQISTSDYHNAQTVARDFIRDIIRPTTGQPLFILGTGYSALTGLYLGADPKAGNIRGIIAYNPYLGGPISAGDDWHSDTQQAGHWGGIAQIWQMSNPDLRRLKKSKDWRDQMKKAFSDVIPSSMSKNAAPILLLEPKRVTTEQANAANALCARLPACVLQLSGGEETLGVETLNFLAQ